MNKIVNLSAVCKCGHRFGVHRDEIDICGLCDCLKFEAETRLEKLREYFQGNHNFSYDFEHDARIYVTALEHKLAIVTALAQMNIDAVSSYRDRVDILERQLRAIKGESDADTNSMG